MRRRVVTVIAVAGAAIGCRTPPEYHPAPLPVGVLTAPAAEETAALAAPAPPPAAPADTFTLPQFVEAVVRHNLRLSAGNEQVAQAQADYITDSLIPNCQLFADAQLLPLQTVDINQQAGPPQYDALLTVPVDWLLFGKRVAAREAARLTVDVRAADQTDLVRRVVTDAVLAVYDYLEAEQLLRLAEEDVTLLEVLEKLIREKKDADATAQIDAERMRLAVLDSYREQHRREAGRDAAKARLRPFLGRTAADPDFTVTAPLGVSKAAPPVNLAVALDLARRHRPDLLRDERAVAQAQATVRREKRKAYPQVAVTSGYSYQDQLAITGFRNAGFGNVAVTSTLPFTDRNQGNVRKAESGVRASVAAWQADTADALAEVEAAVAAYREANEAVTSDDPKSLESAKRVRERTVAAYQKGDKGILDVLDAVRAHRERERNVISTRADYWQALHKLNGVVGLRALNPDAGGE